MIKIMNSLNKIIKLKKNVLKVTKIGFVLMQDFKENFLFIEVVVDFPPPIF
jgi:hypothetical protein